MDLDEILELRRPEDGGLLSLCGSEHCSSNGEHYHCPARACSVTKMFGSDIRRHFKMVHLGKHVAWTRGAETGFAVACDCSDEQQRTQKHYHCKLCDAVCVTRPDFVEHITATHDCVEQNTPEVPSKPASKRAGRVRADHGTQLGLDSATEIAHEGNCSERLSNSESDAQAHSVIDDSEDDDFAVTTSTPSSAPRRSPAKQESPTSPPRGAAAPAGVSATKNRRDRHTSTKQAPASPTSAQGAPPARVLTTKIKRGKLAVSRPETTLEGVGAATKQANKTGSRGDMKRGGGRGASTEQRRTRTAAQRRQEKRKRVEVPDDPNECVDRLLLPKNITTLKARSEAWQTLSVSESASVIFSYIDKDQHGAISQQQLAKSLQSFGMDATEEEVSDMLLLFDTKGHGFLTRDDIHRVCTQVGLGVPQ